MPLGPPGSQHGTVASKLADLLADVIVKHTPWTAGIAEEAKRQRTEGFLEELEQHTAQIMGPLLERLKASGKVAPEIAAVLDSIATPEHQVSAFASQFLVYGIGFSIAGQISQPFLQALSNALWADNTYRPIDPAILATMAVRGLDPGTTDVTPISDDIFAIAAESGYSNQNFQAIVDATGLPPSPQDLFQMWRRQIITTSDLVSGLRQGDTKDSWIPQFQQLAYTTPSPLDMVRAAVQEQLDYATANALAIELGLEPPGFVNNNPDWFQVLFDIAGRPPGPEEVGRMANRGIVGWTGTGADVTTFQQAIAESDVKTKWTDALAALQVYIPPPRQVGSLLQHGAITEEQAKQYWEMSGVPSELADGYVYMELHQVMEQEKLLAKSDILTAYYNMILDKSDALAALELLGYVGTVANDLIAITDARREIKAMNAEVNRIGSYYMHFKIEASEASKALDALGVPADQAAGLLAIWEVDRVVPNRIPTSSEIGKAVEYGTLTQAEGLARLEELGYTSMDAAIVLSSQSQQQVTPLPPQTPPAENV